MCLVRLWILENTPLTLSKPAKFWSLYPQISVVLKTHLLHVSSFFLCSFQQIFFLLNIQCFDYYKSGSIFCAACTWMDMIFLSLGMFPSMILLKICYISLTYYSSSFSRSIIWDLSFLWQCLTCPVYSYPIILKIVIFFTYFV